jgi:DNA-binding transcriptional MerR regulator
MNSFTIKDLENLSGIKAHTIRIWEQRYSFLKPQRTQTNIRYYTSSELKTVLNIALLNKYGFKISHIDKMNEQEIVQKLYTLTDAQAQHEKLVNDLIGYMIDLDVEKFEVAIDKYIRLKGIERTIGHLIFPFLERIGILWQTDHINAAQEHLVTNVVRQKLIVGIDQMNPVIQTGSQVLLFLPEGEHHELGLLYMHFLLKSRGVKVLYLAKDVVSVTETRKPAKLFTHITCIPGSNKIERYLHFLRQHIPTQVPIIVSGTLAQRGPKPGLEGLDLKKSLHEVLEAAI